MTLNYSMVIQWSDEDQVFVVSLPEFGPHCKTHGSTYEEAAKMGQECLETIVDAYQHWGTNLPQPSKYPDSEPDASANSNAVYHQPQPTGKYERPMLTIQNLHAK